MADAPPTFERHVPDRSLNTVLYCLGGVAIVAVGIASLDTLGPFSLVLGAGGLAAVVYGGLVFARNRVWTLVATPEQVEWGYPTGRTVVALSSVEGIVVNLDADSSEAAVAFQIGDGRPIEMRSLLGKADYSALYRYLRSVYAGRMTYSGTPPSE